MRLTLRKTETITVRKKHAVHFSSKTPEWTTPKWLFKRLNKEFDFTLDPACTEENALCPMYYTKKSDGLSQSWNHERVFLNPPYGREIVKWMKKAYESATHHNALVVCLIPSRTDTSWWHSYIATGPWQIRFLKGRLKFGKSKNSAPFPSVVVVMNARRSCLAVTHFSR